MLKLRAINIGAGIIGVEKFKLVWTGHTKIANLNCESEIGLGA